MFVFGVCVESSERFDRFCLPSIAAYGGADATLISSPDLPIAATYNEMLGATLDLADVEAIVLMRDDVELTDPHFVSRVRTAFADDPDLAVIGATRPDAAPRWWQTFHRADADRPHRPGPHETTDPRGPQVDHMDHPGHVDHVGHLGHVDYVEHVDGACLVLRPDLAARLRFDDAAFTGESGFEVDFCHRVKGLGLHVATLPIDLARHADPEDADAAYRQAAAVWQGRRARSVTLGTLEHHLAIEEGTHLGPERFGQLPTPTRTDGVTARHRRALDAVPAEAGRILQLGCGTGAVGARLIAERGSVVVGLDHEGGHLDAARRRLHEVVTCDLNRPADLPHPRGHFDAILAVDILDRLVDPEATLAALLPYLSPTGVLVAAIPNVKHWSVVLPLLLHDRFEYRDAGLLHRGSIHHFTLVEAVAMLRRLGLTRIDATESEIVPLHDPAHLDALVACIGSYGVDAEEARAMLETYEYVVVARRA